MPPSISSLCLSIFNDIARRSGLPVQLESHICWKTSKHPDEKKKSFFLSFFQERGRKVGNWLADLKLLGEIM